MDAPQKLALLIVGIDAFATARLPRILTDAGFRVHLLGSGRLAVARSRYIERRLACPDGPKETAAAARELLLSPDRNCRTEYAYILIADEPTLLAALDQPSTRWLERWFPVPLTADSVLRLKSKTQFLIDCRNAKIPTPRFKACSSLNELSAAADDMGMPLFVKAAEGCAGSGIRFSTTRKEFDDQLATVPLERPAMVQESVKGELVSVSVLYEHGRPVCWFGYLMLHTWPNRFGSACSVEFFSNPGLEEIVHSVGTLTGFHGFAGLDCVLDRASGRLVLLELNPRPTPTYYLGPRVGVDFARGLAMLGTGAPCQNPQPSTEVVDMFPQGLYYAAQHCEPITFLRAFGDAPWNELALTMAHLRRFLTHFAPRALRLTIRRLLARE